MDKILENETDIVFVKEDKAYLNIPVLGTPKAIRDILEKFDSSLASRYLSLAPNCWDHNHVDGVFINCTMDSEKNFQVLGLTKMNLK